MLSYDKFELELIKALEKRYPDAKFVRKSRYRFNGIKQGIEIVGQDNVVPIVYTDNLYEGYQRLEDMELVLDSIDLALECEKMRKFKNIVKDWNQAKKHIYPYIVNMDKNILCMDYNDYVYKQKLDFAYSAYVELPDDDGIACVNITRDLLSLWNISEEEVFEIAEQNAKYDVKPMQQVIAELMDKDVSELDIPEDEVMYVVTNTTKNRGAAGLFDLDLLRRTAEELESDFFILPSSMHEIILVLASSAPSKEQLQESVIDLNKCQANDDDYLSDNVYYYDRKKQTVDIVEFD